MDQSREVQQRVDRIAAFRAELAQLEREGELVLTPEQRARLEQHLQQTIADLRQRGGADVNAAERRLSWAVRVATLLGGVALFAAAVLFLHRVWAFLPLPVQVVVLAGVPCLLLAATDAAHRRLSPDATALLALAAGAAFVLAVNALGTVLNCTPSPHALLAWGAFALLLAYAYRLRLLLAAGLVLLAGYTAALLAQACGLYWLGFLERPEFLLPAALLLYALPWLSRRRQPAGFDPVDRLCGAGLGLLALLLLSLSGDLGCLAPATRATLAQLAGLGLAAGVVVHGLGLGQGPLVSLGSGAFVVFLFARLQAWCWDWMPKYLFFLLLGLTAAGLVPVFLRLRRRLAAGGVP